jgi:hypothetical protein
LNWALSNVRVQQIAMQFESFPEYQTRKAFGLKQALGQLYKHRLTSSQFQRTFILRYAALTLASLRFARSQNRVPNAKSVWVKASVRAAIQAQASEFSIQTKLNLPVSAVPQARTKQFSNQPKSNF